MRCVAEGLVFALLASACDCVPRGKVVQSAPAPPSAVVSTPAPAPSPEPVAVAPAAPLPDAEAIAEMDRLMTRGRVFRYLRVGSRKTMSRAGLHPSRLTWVLEERGGRTAFYVMCERFRHGMGRPKRAPVPSALENPFLLGEANRRDLWWAAPAISMYEGAETATGHDEVRLTLRSTRDSVSGEEIAEGPTCGEMPTALTLTCDTATFPVRPRGARLAYLPMNNENQYNSAWIPPATSPASGLRCSIDEVAAVAHRAQSSLFVDKLAATIPPHQSWAHAPLFFADRMDASPGVEFAYANHGDSLQAGDYRWINPQ